jgi:hypothetical protein
MPDTDWPYDADQDDPLTALRIPVVSEPSPRKAYLACLLIRDDALWPSVRPDDAEARMVASYIDRRRDWFNDRWKAKLLAAPLDCDGGAVTYTFRKRPDGGWCYRMHTWTSGCFFWPLEHGEHARTLTLPELLDHIHGHGEGKPSQPWLDWKAAHPEVFGEVRDAS